MLDRRTAPLFPPLGPAFTALATLALASAPTAQLDEAAVRAAYAEALVAVAEGLGTPLEPAPSLVFVSPFELGRQAALDVHWLEYPEESFFFQAMEQHYSASLIALYSWRTKEILVALPTWHSIARRLGREDIPTPDTARVLLLHELVHALDDRQHSIEALVHCFDEEGTGGVSSVVEGHAQHQTRRLTASLGWTVGFEALLAIVEAPDPARAPEIQDSFAEPIGLATACDAGNPGPGPHSYRDGERFMAALSARNDPALIASVFRNPPEAEAIFHPEWFLDPATRPVARFEAEPALELVVEGRPEPPWFNWPRTLTRAQLRAAAEPLPSARIEPLLESLQGARMVELVSFHPRRRVALAVLEFDDEASAHAYVAAVHERNPLLDERLRRDPTRLLASESVEFEGGRGFWSAKHLEDRGETLDVTSIVLASGPLVLETNFRNEAITPTAHLALAHEALRVVRPR